MKNQQKILQIHKKDNVLVALTDLKKGTKISFENQSYSIQDYIPAKHKFAIKNFHKGDPIYIYIYGWCFSRKSKKENRRSIG